MARPRTPKGRARVVLARLAQEHPGTPAALCELDFADPFQLVTATILSAQTTDVRVNATTPALFERFPTPQALAGADPAEVEVLIHATGFFRQKAKSVIGMASALVERHGGEVPHDIEDLVRLPGVGRKTANVVRSVALDLPGLPVDTHVLRLSGRLGLAEETDPVKVEHELGAFVRPADRGLLSLRLILHGRQVCVARSPRCDVCVLNDVCPSAFQVGAVRTGSPGRAAEGRAPRGRAAPDGAERAAVAEGQALAGRRTARSGRRSAEAAEDLVEPAAPGLE